ncbi:MAG: (d)CMP kinase [Thiotrichales bacterium]|nr:MAG: (d)CMP kinase [Thiotrichales bacterium]
MSKVLVESPEDQNQTPFLRGILTRSLQKSGLTFEQAHDIANAIRDEIGDRPLVTTYDIEHLVVKHLKKAKADHAVSLYENRSMPYMLQVETDNGQFSAFSPARYRTDLEAIGLTSDEALSIVDELSLHLLRRNKPDVTSNYIAKVTYRLLRKSKDLGKKVAHRWLVWRDFIHSGRPLVFLIGGTAGSGKSTIATGIASRLEIARMQSTDMLREVMRTMISKKAEPILHKSSYSAWQELPDEILETEDKGQRIYIGYCKQAEILSVAIRAVIERALHERVSVIVEGVHFHPSIIKDIIDPGEALVVPVMLAVLKRKQLQTRIKGRGTDVPQRRAARYLEHFESIWKLQSFLLSEADQTDVPIISNIDRDDVFREIMLYTIARLSSEFDKTPEQVFD